MNNEEASRGLNLLVFVASDAFVAFSEPYVREFTVFCVSLAAVLFRVAKPTLSQIPY